jgi:hypothetical protein
MEVVATSSGVIFQTTGSFVTLRKMDTSQLLEAPREIVTATLLIMRGANYLANIVAVVSLVTNTPEKLQ